MDHRSWNVKLLEKNSLLPSVMQSVPRYTKSIIQCEKEKNKLDFIKTF